LNQLASDFQAGDIYILSWKTTRTWDDRKLDDAKTNMQGLSEAYAVELRTGQHIMGAKMVHFLTGRRSESPKGSGRWISGSPLVHAWMNASGPTPQFAWSYYWTDPDQVSDFGKPVEHRLGKGWKSVFIPDIMPVPEWVDMLASGTVQPEAGDCLGEQFVTPMPEPRSPQQRHNWLVQLENQEVAVAEYADQLAHADPAQVDELLNYMFPQYTHSCNYPGECEFWHLCWGGEDVDNPISLYQIRQPNHPGEGMIGEEE